MADIEARLNVSAITKGTTWGTEANVNAVGNGIYLTNPGALKLNVDMKEDDQATAFEKNLDVTNINPTDVNFEGDYRWDGNENRLLAYLFGTAPAPTQQAATAAYLHALSLINSTSGIFGTYATEKLGKIHIIPSFKVMKGTFSFNNGFIKYSFGVRGSKVVDTSAVITAMSTVTFPTNAHHRAKAYQGVFRMNAQSGADFSSGDVVSPKAFQLEIERSFDSEHVAGQQHIVEPRANGKPKVKLTMEFPRMDTTNSAYFAAWTAATEQKADITITGPLIASTYYYYLKFQFPRLIIEDVEYADSKVIPAKVVLRAVEADAAPMGMTGLTLPVYCGIMNTKTTTLLA